MNIDWSKAPPHATHWCPGNAKIEPGWIYNPGGNGGEFYSCYTERGLEHIPGFPDWRKSRLIRRPPAWTGEGSIPAGTVCEIRARNLTEWSEAKIVFCSRNVVVWDWIGEPSVNGLCTAYAHGIEIRPVRTPEQIAAEERLAAVNYMEIDAGMCATAFDGDPEARVWIENLIDKGWRKQVAP